MTATLRVCALYPELMNIYADRGNIAVLRARCEWRGLGFELGRRHDRRAARPRPRTTSSTWAAARTATRRRSPHDMADGKREPLHAAADRGAVVLAVCGGYQLLGHAYEMGGEELPGVGLVDLRTVREEGPRLIGNCAIEADLGTGPRVIAGFENHGGRTYLGAGEQPLGRVLKGHGNNGARRRRGRPPGQRDRHLPPRAAAAEERLARRPPDRAGARRGAGAAGRQARGRGARLGAARGRRLGH